MNPTAILALISDLHTQITSLMQENSLLRQKLEAAQVSVFTDPSES